MKRDLTSMTAELRHRRQARTDRLAEVDRLKCITGAIIAETITTSSSPYERPWTTLVLVQPDGNASFELTIQADPEGNGPGYARLFQTAPHDKDIR